MIIHGLSRQFAESEVMPSVNVLHSSLQLAWACCVYTTRSVACRLIGLRDVVYRLSVSVHVVSLIV